MMTPVPGEYLSWHHAHNLLPGIPKKRRKALSARSLKNSKKSEVASEVA
jgi:hypothetical protein